MPGLVNHDDHGEGRTTSPRKRLVEGLKFHAGKKKIEN